MLHKFRVQYILIDFSDNGFLVSQFRFPSILKKTLAEYSVPTSGYYGVAQLRCCLMALRCVVVMKP